MNTEKDQNKALNKTDVMQSVMARDLRIGNYIFSKETQSIQKITGITEEHPFFDSITFDYPNWDEIEPIKITVEWLEMLGFKQNKFDSVYEIDNCQIEIYFFDNESRCTVCVDSVINKKIEYVHQLQNLYFSLTGSELTVA